MKINSITIQGFRGFIEARTLEFHDHLTLIYAPNSYGKTSISEALEWLLYGITSKVEHARPKSEFKGSYRNPHLPDSEPVFVEAVFDDNGVNLRLRAELVTGDAIQRYVDGRSVEDWPFLDRLRESARPFILQHSLKDLLMVEPSERFKGFARLVGLEDIDRIQRNFDSFFTKYDAPEGVKRLHSSVSTLFGRVEEVPSLSAIVKAMKSKKGIQNLRTSILEACRSHIDVTVSDDELLPELSRVRGAAVGKVYKGNVKVQEYSADDTHRNTAREEHFLACLADEFVNEYSELARLASIQHLRDQCEFHRLGVSFLNDSPGICPLCEQSVSAETSVRIIERFRDIHNETNSANSLFEQQKKISDCIEKLQADIRTYHSSHSNRILSLVAAEKSVDHLKSMFGPEDEEHSRAILTGISDLLQSKRDLDTFYGVVSEALQKLLVSAKEAKPNVEKLQSLSEGLSKYIAQARQFAMSVNEHSVSLAHADTALQARLDALAGTTEVTILMDLLQNWDSVRKHIELENTIEGLKDLKKTVSQHTSERIADAVSGEFTRDVMVWYDKIKTQGDPDVHFQGFDVPKTAKGDLKGRNIDIKAESYGKSLASAVSSLSESKLNALGLCISIATNLRCQSPIPFLLIDDPIQSWDIDHETQFVEIIRSLAEGTRQVILLSHNKPWIERVRTQCRSINGWYYEISGYSKDGPCINAICWDKWKNRLDEIDAILKDPNCDNLRLQQAEEEFRMAIGDITSELYFKHRKVRKNPYSMNSTNVRKLLVECNIDKGLVDRIVGTYSTVDDSHHDGGSYCPNKERLRCYYGWAHELGRYLK